MRRRGVRELLAVLGFALILGPYVVFFEKLGWLGFFLTTAMLTGNLLMFLVGLPKFFTDDLSKTLPADARERLGWDKKRPQS